MRTLDLTVENEQQKEGSVPKICKQDRNSGLLIMYESISDSTACSPLPARRLDRQPLQDH